MNTLKMLVFLVFMSLSISLQGRTLSIIDTRCENQQAPLGVQSPSPAFSWKLSSNERNVAQKAYRILISDDVKKLRKDQGTLWDSNVCSSSRSIHVLYAGEALASATRYYWKVKVWDNQNKESAWSEVNTFQIGLLTQDDWQPAQWIAMETAAQKDLVFPGYQLAGNKVIPLEREATMPQFRKSFVLAPKKVASATAFISGLGHFELSINGHKIGDHFLDPGWTNYDKSSLYVTFDITEQLRKGENAIGVRLGNGFLHIPRDSTRYRKLITTFAFPKMICKLRVVYTDGSVEDINSNRDWRVTTSPLTFSSIYGGEDYDATREQSGWNQPGFDDSSWQSAQEIAAVGKLTSQTSLPLKVRKKLKSIGVQQPKPGTYVFDFGQNASAIVSLKVKGKAGSRVIMRPAEYLTDEGLANQQNSGNPYWYAYTLSGGGHSEHWQPSFSYYGFRFVEVEGAVPAGVDNPGQLPVIEELELWHITNSSDVVGQFTCSNPMLNEIQSLIDWSVRSNMVSVLTDCPHREKLGWLEVAHLMSSSIAYTYDIKQMYTKIIEDMKNSQLDNGLVPSTAPEFANFGNDFRDSPEWGSASVILPWFLYKRYGDSSVLSSSYELMTRYAAYLTSRTKDHILYHGLGDWYDLGPNHPGYSQLTARGLTPTAMYYYDLKVLAQTSELLGKKQAAASYTALAAQVKQAFNAKFFNREKGYYDQGSQTANAIPLYMDLVDECHRQSCLNQIIADVRSRGNAITAGDIGFSYLLRVLESESASDVIFDMNSQSDKPGYGYQLKQGATSLTESWAALKTASHNHCMLGHLAEWFYSGIGGIRADKNSVAFQRFIIHPEVVGDVRSADVSYESPYGKIENHWQLRPGVFECAVSVPVNTTALIYLPSTQQHTVTEGGKPVSSLPGIRFVGTEKGRLVYEVGSGNYAFVVNK